MQFEKAEIHTVFLASPNFHLEQNLSLSVLADLIIGYSRQGAIFLCGILTNHDNFTIETDGKKHLCKSVKVFLLQRFLDFMHFVISLETGWK